VEIGRRRRKRERLPVLHAVGGAARQAFRHQSTAATISPIRVGGGWGGVGVALNDTSPIRSMYEVHFRPKWGHPASRVSSDPGGLIASVLRRLGEAGLIPKSGNSTPSRFNRVKRGLTLSILGMTFPRSQSRYRERQSSGACRLLALSYLPTCRPSYCGSPSAA